MPRHALPAFPVESGLAWASVVDAHGRLYLSDEFNHRVVVSDVTARSWTFGQSGAGAGDLRFPRGLAVCSRPTLEATRVFVADSRNHRVQVFDAVGRPQFAFGGFGTGPGQFRAPADLVIARPELPWEGDRGRREAAELLIVADQWNGRLQVFTLDGVWLATIGGRTGTSRNPHSVLTASPFFRFGAAAVPRDPVRLSWQLPCLTVVGGNGRQQQFDLTSALLPSFEQWQASALPAERAHARRYFEMLSHGRRGVPTRVLDALAIAGPTV